MGLYVYFIYGSVVNVFSVWKRFDMERVGIKTEYIKLDQLLKWAGAAETGSHAKMMIQSGSVKVNGEVEKRRGRKIRGGDVVEAEGMVFEVYNV